jgi:hypothetical protein
MQNSTSRSLVRKVCSCDLIRIDVRSDILRAFRVCLITKLRRKGGMCKFGGFPSTHSSFIKLRAKASSAQPINSFIKNSHRLVLQKPD